jgi:hypothetical protein
MTTGIIIGRFQVPELTLGHKSLLLRAYDHFDQVGVLLGCSHERNPANPLPYGLRVQLFTEWELTFVEAVHDVPGKDTEWSLAVDRTVDGLAISQRLGKITLVGGRQSFIPHYCGTYPVREFDIWRGKSGTDIRKAITAEDSVSFRKGVIWQVMNAQ